MPSLSAMAREAKKAKSSQKSLPVKKNEKKKPAAALFNRSTEKVADSDLESETESEDDSSSESDSEKKPAPTVAPTAPKTNGQSQKERAPSSSSSSESESGSDTSSEASSEEESEESEQDEQSEPTAVSAATRRKSTTPLPPPAKRAKTIAYTPPKGFEILSETEGAKTKASKFFSTANLAGKQLWYITAPASIPINSIKKVSMKDVQSGKSAITVDGHDYGFVREKAEEQEAPKMMLPDEDGKQYNISKRAIDNTLHLQQVVKLPGATSGSASKHTVPQNKPVRKQPEGLKMRFKPIGYGKGAGGIIGTNSPSEASSDSDEGMEDIRPQFKAPPKGTESSSSEISDSDEEMVDAQETIEPSLKADAKANVASSNASSSESSSDSSDSGSET